MQKKKKFAYDISESDIANAVKLWTTRLDGYDGAIGGIFAEIPWSAELDKVLPWDKIERRFDEAIGMAKDFNIKDLIIGHESVHSDLDKFAYEVAERICNVYANAIAEANDLLPKETAYAVDVNWVVSKTYRIVAKSKEEAEKILFDRVCKGEICVRTDGFEGTDDVTTKCVGEEDEHGDVQYY